MLVADMTASIHPFPGKPSLGMSHHFIVRVENGAQVIIDVMGIAETAQGAAFSLRQIADMLDPPEDTGEIA
jgi:hypothetical protein